MRLDLGGFDLYGLIRDWTAPLALGPIQCDPLNGRAPSGITGFVLKPLYRQYEQIQNREPLIQ